MTPSRYLLTDDRTTQDLRADSLTELMKLAAFRWRAGVPGIRIIDTATHAQWTLGRPPVAEVTP